MDPNLKKAIELQRKGDLHGGIRVLRQSVAAGSRSAQSHYFLGILEEAVGEIEKAFDSIERALKLAPNESDFHFSKGNICQKLGRVSESIAAYERCVHLHPDHVHGLVNLSLSLQRCGEWLRALNFAKRALKVAPSETKAWLAYIGTLGFLRQFDEGLRACKEAEGVFGCDQVELLHMHGNILLASGRVDEALPYYQRALELSPNSVPVLISMGDFYAQYRNGRDAIPYLEKALSLSKNPADARSRLGSAYLSAGFPADAVPILLEVVKQHPENSDAFDSLILAAAYLQDADEKEIYQLHLQWAKHHGERWYPQSMPSCQMHSGALRVGFVSPDFRNHSVTRFMTPLLRHIADSGCEVICYSDIKQKNTYTRVLETFEAVHWVYSYTLTDEALANRIRSDRVDVLVDLAGHTGNNRLQVFARKPAPVQVSWLGYPNTTGLATMDYRLSDGIADPVGESDTLSTEKIIRMADGFHCFEPPLALPDTVQTPALEKGFVTFGSFNNQSKINQLTLERWAGVLEAVPGSHLLLKNHQLSDSRNREHWLRVMDMLGIDVSRVELVGYAENLEDHYRTYERVDIGLDTFPYNGTTTTCEALWMGVPVLTMAGNSQRARTGASLLIHAGLGDWVARDDRDFVGIASRWAEKTEALNVLRLSLRERLQQSPIGDAKAFASKFFTTLRSFRTGAEVAPR